MCTLVAKRSKAYIGEALSFRLRHDSVRRIRLKTFRDPLREGLLTLPWHSMESQIATVPAQDQKRNV